MLHNAKDSELRARAARVVPGGMWGHQNAANLPEGYPQFFRSAQGCRIRDVDGNEYIDRPRRRVYTIKLDNLRKNHAADGWPQPSPHFFLEISTIYIES